MTGERGAEEERIERLFAASAPADCGCAGAALPTDVGHRDKHMPRFMCPAAAPPTAATAHGILNCAAAAP